MINQINVPLKMLDPELEVPRYAKDGDAGVDLRASETLVLQPGERALVKTGVAIALPAGYVGLVHPRSGLAVKHGITVVNAPGTVDSGYRGEIMVCLLNTDRTHAFEINRGDRIAQLVIQQVAQTTFEPVEELETSARGATGFGSSGVN